MPFIYHACCWNLIGVGKADFFSPSLMMSNSFQEGRQVLLSWIITGLLSRISQGSVYFSEINAIITVITNKVNFHAKMIKVATELYWNKTLFSLFKVSKNTSLAVSNWKGLKCQKSLVFVFRSAVVCSWEKQPTKSIECVRLEGKYRFCRQFCSGYLARS